MDRRYFPEYGWLQYMDVKDYFRKPQMTRYGISIDRDGQTWDILFDRDKQIFFYGDI